MSSDQKFTNIASTGQVKTISGGSVNIGPCRITYIQANGVASSTISSIEKFLSKVAVPEVVLAI